MDSQAIASQIADYDKNRKSSVDVLNSAMSQYGIPEIRSRVSGLRTTLSNTENALNNVDPSVTGRTQGSLVTEAQRQRQVANERAPIAEQYGQQSRALGDESGNLSDSLSAAKLLAENQINDYSTGRSALQGQYDIASSREAETRRQLEADRAFSLQKQAAAQAAGYNVGNGNSTQTNNGLPAGFTEQKDGLGNVKGYSFTGKNGKPVTAAVYASQNNIALSDVLYKLASLGDAPAQSAYQWLKSIQGTDLFKSGKWKNTPAFSNFSSLLGGA